MTICIEQTAHLQAIITDFDIYARLGQTASLGIPTCVRQSTWAGGGSDASTVIVVPVYSAKGCECSMAKLLGPIMLLGREGLC